MPELPEVEAFRRFAERHALNRTIGQVQVFREKILQGVTAEELSAATVGRRFFEARRLGKHLLLGLENVPTESSPKTPDTTPKKSAAASKKPTSKHSDNSESSAIGPWVVLHFGMTGYLGWFDAHTRIINAYGDPSRPEAHIRVQFDFEDGGHLAFHEQRMFGKISLTDDPDAYARHHKLGPDALSIEEAKFTARLRKRKGQLKPALMAQDFVAGIGNVYADEMMFQCKLHPELPLAELRAADIRCLYRQMVEILQATVDCNADRDCLPKSYLLHDRHKKARCPRDKTPLAAIQVGGRTTYFCPHCQVLK